MTMTLRAPLLIDFDARERIPVRVHRRVALHALGIHNVDQLVVKVSGDQHQQEQRHDRRGQSLAGRAHATACQRDDHRGENRIVFGPPMKFSSGTSARQASDPPSRSAP